MTTIENRRFALLVAGGVIVFFLYQAWQKDFAPAAQPSAPAAVAPEAGDAPAVAGDTPVGAPAPGSPAATPAAESTAPAQRITVQTDRYSAVIGTQGGELRHLELIGYPVAKSQPDKPVALLDDEPNRWFVVQSGITGPGGAVVSHKETFRAASQSYALAEGADTLEVPLTWTDGQGRELTKIYRFHRGSYVIELVQSLKNGGAAPLAANAYVQLWRTPFSVGEEPPFVKTFTGVGLHEQKSGGGYRFRKEALEKLPEDPIESAQTGGWIAMLQHYFLVAVLPPADEALRLIAKPSSTQGYVAQYVGATQTVAPGASQDFATRLYVGPKLQNSIAAVAPGLELTVDYGILTPVAEPLFWLLDWFHRHVKNWGLAIILLTLSVKLALYKLSESQYRSMAKMKKYAPRMQELKERYGDARERLHKAMMELYKKEKFNPLAGCWPILIQFPVFIALYWVLLESVELRQADFMFWIHDLSAKDPYFVLPVLFGISMWVQQKLSGNVAPDPMQQRVMSIMPVALAAFFTQFPAGLVLYWFVSNLIGIAQQAYIVRKLEREDVRR